MRSIVTVGISVLALYLLTQPQSLAVTADAWNDKDNSSTRISRITPFSIIQQDFEGTARDYFSNAYTRLLVVSPVESVGKKPDADETELPYKKRWWLTRFLMGRHSSTNLSIKVSVG